MGIGVSRSLFLLGVVNTAEGECGRSDIGKQ